MVLGFIPHDGISALRGSDQSVLSLHTVRTGKQHSANLEVGCQHHLDLGLASLQWEIIVCCLGHSTFSILLYQSKFTKTVNDYIIFIYYMKIVWLDLF